MCRATWQDEALERLKIVLGKGVDMTEETKADKVLGLMEAVGEIPPQGLNIVDFKTELNMYVERTKDILLEAAELGYEGILIVGMKDDKVYIKASPTIDNLKKLGMIEAAKLHFVAEWK